MAILAKTGDSRTLRLDPYQSTHHLQVGTTHFKLDRNGAVVKKTLSCGLPVAMAVPARAFEGVAARAIEHDDGSISVTLELKHHDPELSVPLLFAHDMDDVSADWHSWSRMMKLPMLLMNTDGTTTPVTKQLGALMVEEPIERRKRITGVKHRPNFLRRRKKGVIGPIEKITPAELMARV